MVLRDPLIYSLEKMRKFWRKSSCISVYANENNFEDLKFLKT